MIRNLVPVLLVLLVLLLTACGGGGGNAIQYYLVDPVSLTPITDGDGPSIQIVDLQLPQYLERFQIASRRSGNRVVYSDAHQWGEGLRKNLTRALAVNLSELLQTDRISTPIHRSAEVPTYQVQVYILKFERDASDVLRLSARWQITKTGSVSATRSESFSSVSAIARYDLTVSAMANLLGELAAAIATDIDRLESGT